MMSTIGTTLISALTPPFAPPTSIPMGRAFLSGQSVHRRIGHQLADDRWTDGSMPQAVFLMK
jgi:hypothetical protein